MSAVTYGWHFYVEASAVSFFLPAGQATNAHMSAKEDRQMISGMRCLLAPTLPF